MTEPVPDYVKLKSKEPSPTALESSVELSVPTKPGKTRYVLYNWLAFLGFIMSIVSLILYLACHFPGLLITFSALGTIAVGAGCFFSYLAISRIDPKKQTYAFVAFCLAAGVCFTTSIISLNLVFSDYKPVSNLAFRSTEPITEPIPVAVPIAVSMPTVAPPPQVASEPVSIQNIEPSYVPYAEPDYKSDGGNADSSDPNSPVSSTNTDLSQNSASISVDPSVVYVNQAIRLPYGYTSPYYPSNSGNSYSYSSSYSNSYTYWYSDPYPYSISYSYSYSTSSSSFGSNYYVGITTSYDNNSPYGQPSYSNSYSYSGSINDNRNGYDNGGIIYDPPTIMPLYVPPGEPYEDPMPTPDPTSIDTLNSQSEPEPQIDPIQYDEPTYNAEESNTNQSSPVSPIDNTNNADDSSSTNSTSDNDPSDAYTSQVYPEPSIAPGEPTESGSFKNTGYTGRVPGYNPGYTSYSSSSSISNSYTYSYSDPSPYSISYSYTYSNSDSSYGSSYSIFSNSNYDNYSPYGQPSYSVQYSYSSSYNNDGNGYTYTYYPSLRPLYAYPASQPYYSSSYTSGYIPQSYAYTTYQPYSSDAYGQEPQTPQSYAYTTYEPNYPNYNNYGVEESQTQPSYSSSGSGYAGYTADYPTDDATSAPQARLYKTNTNNVHTSGVSSVIVALVFLFIIKALLFVALITQAHELKNELNQKKQFALEESTIKSESQIV